MTTTDRVPLATTDLLSPEPDLTTPELELTALDTDPAVSGEPSAAAEQDRARADQDPTASPLVGAVSAVGAWAQSSPRLDPTEPPPELRTVATDREHTVTAAMSHRRVVSLEVHPEIWMSDPADVTDAIIDAVNAVLTQHEADARAELELRRSGIGEVTRAASDLHDSVAEALGRELDDVIASVTRGGTATTVRPTEARP